MYSCSSMGSLSNTAENVRMLSPIDAESGAPLASSSLMTQTIVEESRPPDKQVPTVTSATSRRSTALLKAARKTSGSAGALAESSGCQ